MENSRNSEWYNNCPLVAGASCLSDIFGLNVDGQLATIIEDKEGGLFTEEEVGLSYFMELSKKDGSSMFAIYKDKEPLWGIKLTSAGEIKVGPSKERLRKLAEIPGKIEAEVKRYRALYSTTETSMKTVARLEIAQKALREDVRLNVLFED